MYSDAAKKSLWLPAAAVLLIAAFVVMLAFRDPGRDISAESAQSIQRAVERSALQCYAVEGVYPPTLKYLEDHYGLQVNHEDFYITYDIFASNMAPDVIVRSKK